MLSDPVYVIQFDGSPIGVASSLDKASERVREYADSQGCDVMFFDDGSFSLTAEDDPAIGVAFGAIYEFNIDGEV